jgi:hypothetical protein
MTYAPATLNELVAYWRHQGGVNLGVVGDTAHVKRGQSYHLGADHLAAGAYSTKTPRDAAGLTNAASAMDLGRLDGSLVKLREFSSWLVDEARENQPGTSDMREIIYSPDGRAVLRWDRERGYASAPQAGEADLTHLTHTHVSWYRDAEKRDHTTAFKPYFEGDQTMADTWEPEAGAAGTFTVTKAGNMIDAISGTFTPVAVGYVRNVYSEVVWRSGTYKGQTGYLGSLGDRPEILMGFLGEFVPTGSSAGCTEQELATAREEEQQRIAEAIADQVRAI